MSIKRVKRDSSHKQNKASRRYTEAGRRKRIRKALQKSPRAEGWDHGNEGSMDEEATSLSPY